MVMTPLLPGTLVAGALDLDVGVTLPVAFYVLAPLGLTELRPVVIPALVVEHIIGRGEILSVGGKRRGGAERGRLLVILPICPAAVRR